MTPNYYTLLGLNVDTFISDPAELDKRLEAVKLEWNKQNNTDINSYVATYYTSGVVKEAYNDPARWKSIYEQAKAQTDDAIMNYLMLSSGKGFLYEKEIESCSKNKNIAASVDYVRRIAEAQGIEIRQNAGTAQKSSAKKVKLSLADFEPQSKIAFSAPTKSCTVNLQCADFYDFLRKYSKQSGIATQVYFTTDTAPEVCAKAAEEIISAWSGKKENTEKTAVENVCTIIKKFAVQDDKCSQENYNKHLKYTSIKAVLDSVWSPMSKLDEKDRILSGEAQMSIISDLEKVVGNRAGAESVLENYCREKKISTEMTDKADRAFCPFCSSVFKKQGAQMPESCPVCRHSFVMKCPKCSKNINYAEKRECSCGFDLGIYPTVSKLCEDAGNFIGTLNFDYAEAILADVEKRWKNFPEAVEARTMLTQKKGLVGKMVGSLEKYMSAREFISAKAEYERICKAVPGYSDTAVEMRINTELEEAENLFKRFRSENDQQEKLRLLIEIKKLVEDYPGVDSELSSIPPMPITSCTAGVDPNTGFTNLQWVSPDPDGTVEFELRRKAFSKPVSASDGELVAKTTDKGFSDKSVKEGEAYFYSITAVRGRTRSKPVIIPKLFAIFPTFKSTPEVNCDETMIEVSWKVNMGKMTAEVFRSENPMIQKYGDGVKVRDCGQNGFVDTDLKVGRTYYYLVFFRIDIEGKTYISKPFPIKGTTARKGRPVKLDIKASDSIKGRFEAAITEGMEFSAQIQLYTAAMNSFVSGTSLQLTQLTSSFGMKRLNFVNSGTGILTFDLPEGESCYVYPVTVTGNNAVLGEPVFAENYKQIGVRPLKMDGMNLHIELEEWVKDQEMLYVCWRNDRYPEELNEKGNSKISVNRRNYQSEGIVIPNVVQKNYYIKGFVKSGGNEHPIFKTEFLNAKKLDIVYSFAYTGLLSKQLKITMTMSEPSPLPELSLRVMAGSSAPVYESSGTELCVIPADSEAKKEHTFVLPGKLSKNLRGKLFLVNDEDKNIYRMLLKSGESTLLVH